MSKYLTDHEIAAELAATEESLSSAIQALFEERAMVDALITVLDRYMETVDPDENEWTAGNWQLRKKKMMSQYEELLRSRSYLKEYGL